ncbi:uncharacterized protein TM35_000171900 [Trypanosoma theileri]|uniref:Uncharacterized protein n=1 Tax=Trypanosoma theileri TaxID=67003 RepID=A0A1X0NUU9_9TRYP|nr:uncharacterized protein TM35_000171900 [Trypanosoma theileri]ORC88318.1 hypothetical protein TM35_000171900 [Trypanosoma theileri]
MFAEVSFEDEEDALQQTCNDNTGNGVSTLLSGKTTPSIHSSSYNSNINNNNNIDTAAVGVVRFHHPGDEGFSCVAGTVDDVHSLYDTRHVSGDAWLSNECHCLRCETLRASTHITALRNHTQLPIVVVLLDLDNYGFNQFKSAPPSLAVKDGFNCIDHMFLWCFFGSCFTRYHGVFPDAASVCEQLPANAQDEKNGKPSKHVKMSVWRRLVMAGRCHFTPCGGQQQAADSVMMRAAHALTHMPCIVVSGDRGLLQTIYMSRSSVGKKRKRDEMDSEFLSECDVINVLEHGKRFVPVWRALEKKIQVLVQQ